MSLIKRRVKFIFSNKTKCDTKDIVKAIASFIIALFILFLIIFIKFEPVYEVKLGDETIGYIKSKADLQKIINDEILKPKHECEFLSTLDVEPTYNLILANKGTTNENEVIEKLSEEVTTLYRVYSITINGENKNYVNTYEEAEQISNDMKAEYANLENLEISVVEEYTKNIDEIGTVELTVAKASINDELRTLMDEQEKKEKATFNGIYFAVAPVIGNITSRYGAVEYSVRNHAHSGLDIAAPYGTSIKAAAPGKVTYSGWQSGYGNLIIIDHGNNVQSYYGHCSSLVAKVGDEVEAGDIIAKVGSTGNSTGNHLHFEIRLNGSTVNPQKYLYN